MHFSKLLMNRSLLSWVCFVTFMILSHVSSAQFEVEDLVTVPKTPEAAAFTEYANTASVSLYTGKASVSVPIDGLQGRSMSHPVSLTYMTGGIKVQQEAGVAGLGWNLNAGGMVSRNVNGLPDDYITADDDYFPFYSSNTYTWGGVGEYTIFDVYKIFRDEDYGIYFDGSAELNEIYEGPYRPYTPGGLHELYRDFVRRVTSVRDIEIEQDTYSFNVGNLSGTLVIDYETLTAYCIEHPDLLVNVSFSASGNSTLPISSWKITDNQGTSYEFVNKETTTIKSDGGFKNSANGRTYNSSWYLTQINNDHLKDKYTFFYDTYATEQYGLHGYGDVINDRYIQGDISDQDCGTGSGLSQRGVIYYSYEKCRLNNIRVNGSSRMNFIYDNNRLDLSSESLLDGIEVYDITGRLINEFDFGYSYFGTPDTTLHIPQRDYVSRLKLDNVFLLGDLNSLDTMTWAFAYDSQSLPDRNSFAQDYWGFYNGADGNQTLIPENAILDGPTDVSGNREANTQYMQAGVLKSVSYPTGGSTRFIYQANNVPEISTVQSTESIAAFSFSGGVYGINEDPYNYESCDPQSSVNGIPFVMFDALTIEEAAVYNVTVSSSGGSNDAIQAVAFKNGSFNLCDALQPSDSNTFDLLELNPDEFGTSEVTLQPGKYLVMIMNDQIGEDVVLSVSRQIQAGQLIYKPAGGLKIVSKDNLDENGQLVNSTVYRYKNVANPNSNLGSSAVLHQSLIFEEISTRETVAAIPNTGNQHLVQCESVNRYATNQATATPNIISYTIVSELNVDSDGNPNGATVFEFYNDNEGVGKKPFMKTHVANGMVKNKWVYKLEEGTYMTIASEHNIYDVKPLEGLVGYSFSSSGTAFLDPLIESHSTNDSARWVYSPMYFTSIGSETNLSMAPCAFDNRDNLPDSVWISDIVGYETVILDGQETTIPQFSLVLVPNDEFANPLVLECKVQTNQISINYQQRHAIPRSWLRMDSTITYQYVDDLKLSTIKTYVYDSLSVSKQFQVRSVTSEYPHAKTESLHYYYALDSATEDSGLEQLVDQNRVAEPFRVVRTVDGVEKSIKRTVYDSQGRPEIIQIAHDSPEVALGALDDYLEDQVEVLEYNSVNNKPQKLRDQTGLINYYLWGDAGQHLILHMKIDDPDFEPLLPAGEGAPGDLLLSKHQRYAALPNAIVNCYEYEPGRGISRQIDPNGRSTYYEYDSFGRLLRVLDHEGHVLSQNEYHFANQND